MQWPPAELEHGPTQQESGQQFAKKLRIKRIESLTVRLRRSIFSASHMASTRKHTYPNLKAFVEAMSAKGLDHAAVAAFLGISQGFLSDLKNGKVTPSMRMAGRLSERADVPVDSFLAALTDS
jgi:transcriptional regulator with XRE-family HTH domain